MADPLRGALALTRIASVIPALFRRLDALVVVLDDVQATVADMRDEVVALRRQVVDELASIHTDTEHMTEGVGRMAHDVGLLEGRMRAVERELETVGAVAGRFAPRAHRARRAAGDGDADQR